MAILDEFLAQNIERLLEERRMNQRELAKAAKIHPISLNRYIKKHHWPDPEYVERIAGVLGVQPWELYMPENLARAALPQDIADALTRCGPEEFESIRVMLRGYGLISPSKAEAPPQSTQSDAAKKP